MPLWLRERSRRSWHFPAESAGCKFHAALREISRHCSPDATGKLPHGCLQWRRKSSPVPVLSGACELRSGNVYLSSAPSSDTRLVKLWRRSIAQQFDLDASFKALEDGQRKRMACTKALRLPRWNGLACRDQKSDASSDVFHLGDDERASTRVLQLVRRREFHARPRRCPVGGLTNRTIMTLSCLHPIFSLV
jgi:hypothetical protein